MSEPTPKPPAGPQRGDPAGRWSRGDAVLVIFVVGVLVWLTGQVLLLVFAGALLATAIDGLASPLAQRLRIARGWAVTAVVVVLAVVLVGGGGAIAPSFIVQFGQLWEQLGELATEAIGAAEEYTWLRQLMGTDSDEPAFDIGSVVGSVTTATITVFGGAGALLLVAAIAMFAAADPTLYRRGAIALVPPRHRARVDETLSGLGHALRWWLLGQLIAMLLLGTTTAIGLFLLGVELWLGLGVLVGLLTFIPFLGPIIAGIPVLLIAFTDGLQTGLAVLVFYLVLQNLEGNVLTPMIQRRVVHVAPAMLIAVQVLFGTLFGAAGLILASPLAVALMVAIKRLYIEDMLGDHSARETP